MIGKALMFVRRRSAAKLSLWLGALSLAAVLVSASLFFAERPMVPKPTLDPMALDPLPLETGFPKWGSVMARTWARTDGDDTVCSDRLGRDCNLRSWRRFLEGLRDRPLLARIEAVNSFVNGVRYRADEDNWGVGDYWAAPGEFFASGGDCEDYAIAKYYSLRALGFPAERLRIVVLHDDKRKLPHAVLAVRWSDGELILDNLGDEIAPWAQAPHYKPIYSVNERRYQLLGLPPAKIRAS